MKGEEGEIMGDGKVFWNHSSFCGIYLTNIEYDG